MSRDARGSLVGAVFGLVFVVVNAGDLAPAYAVAVRVVGVVAFVVVVTLLVRRPTARPLPDVDPAGWRLYLLAVGLEVLALFVGLALLGRSGHQELSVPWVALVVGVHFLPLARAFRAPFFATLGLALAALGVAGAALAVAGAGAGAVSLVSGVCSGFVLLGTALRPVLAR